MRPLSSTSSDSEFGKKISTRLAVHGTRITVQKFNVLLGRRVLVNYGARNGAARATPLVGGLVGGAIDASVTCGIGATAKVIFRPLGPSAHL